MTWISHNLLYEAFSQKWWLHVNCVNYANKKLYQALHPNTETTSASYISAEGVPVNRYATFKDNYQVFVLINVRRDAASATHLPQYYNTSLIPWKQW